MWKMFAVVVASTPFLIVFIGVGVLAMNISSTWDSRNTDALISGLVASCSMGGVIVGGLLALLIGIPMAIRIMREANPPYGPPYVQARPTRSLPPVWMQEPPQIEIKANDQGTWESPGVHVYDLENNSTFE